jgi:HemY protein
VIRGIAGLIVIAALVAAGVFFADRPGRVEIIWQGWQVETSVGVLVVAAALTALGAGLLYSLIAMIIRSPRRLRRYRRERRRRAGYRALAQGMVAVAAGDPQEARRYAKKADVLLADPPLTLLLSAQAAQLDGDEDAAKNYFTAMLERPETEFLGLRGLLNQALRADDRSTALRLAERATALRPGAQWAALSRFSLETRAGAWEAARETLAFAAKRRLIPRDRARHHRGVLLFELSRTALATGERRRALGLAAEAQALTPDLATPAAHHARLLLEERRIGRAARAVERAWRTAPHPELAQVYGAIHDGEPPLARFKSCERLAAENPAARESRLMVAEAALDAQLWGEARHHLEEAMEGAPTTRLCLLMARLEEAEHGEPGAGREWLDRAITAPPDPRYHCASCGGESLEWRSLCPHCGAFDALSWRIPISAARGGNLALPAERREGSLPLAELPIGRPSDLAAAAEQAKSEPPGAAPVAQR